MILRLTATAAAFGAGGMVVGVTTVLAACTMARGLSKAGGRSMRRAMTPQMPPSPYTPPSAAGRSSNTGPATSGSLSGQS